MDLASGAATSAVSPELWVGPKAAKTLPWLLPAESLGFFSALIKIMTLQSQFCLPESFLQVQGMERGVTSKESALPQAAPGDVSRFSPPPPDHGLGNSPASRAAWGQEFCWTTIP